LDHRSLPGPLVTDRHDPVFQDACLEPFLDQADDASVADAMFHKLDEPLLAHRVEERADVGVQYPVHLCASDPDHERIHRIVRAASRPEPIREPEEIFLVDRAQHRSRGPLDDLVLKGGDRDPARHPIRLGYLNPPRRQCPIRSPMDAGMQVLEIALKVLLVVPTCQPIHPRCSILLEFKECLLEVIDTDVVEERGELLLLPLPCSLPYALQRLGHAHPVLRPARALLARISLGLRPWLRRLRSGSLRLVRRLPSYYGGVRLLMIVHHRLRLLAFPTRTSATRMWRWPTMRSPGFRAKS